MSLNCLESGLQPLVKLLQVTGLRQNRVSQGIEEDAFGVGGPPGAAKRDSEAQCGTHCQEDWLLLCSLHGVYAQKR